MISRSLMIRSENAPSIRRSAASTLAAVVERLREQMQNDFAVGRGLENRAFAFQLVAQDGGVDQVAVVRDRDLAADAIDHERLRVFDRARAGRGITGVPDRARAFQPLQLGLAEDLRDQAHVVVDQKRSAGPVAGDDAGAFLAAMLQREKPVVGEHRGVRMAEDGEEAALVLREMPRAAIGSGWSILVLQADAFDLERSHENFHRNRRFIQRV